MPMSLSASDWTRIKRVQHARDYFTVLETNSDITNVALQSNPFSPPFMKSRVVGSSKTRREASKWTDFIASRAQDYVLTSESYNAETNMNTGISQNTLVQVNCNCGTITGPNSKILTSKITGCIKCKFGQQ